MSELFDCLENGAGICRNELLFEKLEESCNELKQKNKILANELENLRNAKCSDEQILKENAALLFRAEKAEAEEKSLYALCKRAKNFIHNGVAIGRIQLPEPELNDPASTFEQSIDQAIIEYEMRVEKMSESTKEINELADAAGIDPAFGEAAIIEGATAIIKNMAKIITDLRERAEKAEAKVAELEDENKSIRHLLSLWKKTEAMKEIERLRSYLKVIENEAPKRNVDWCRRIAKEVLGEE